MPSGTTIYAARLAASTVSGLTEESRADVRYELLGTLRVWWQRSLVMIPAPHQRSILAKLLLNANSVVSVDTLAETLWEDRMPRAGPVVIRNYVARLRRALGPSVGHSIKTSQPGYVIEVAENQLDLWDFNRLTRAARDAARDGRLEESVQLLAEALSLCRSAPLGDVPSSVIQREDVPRLAEIRIQAHVWYLDAQLRLGRHEEIIVELRKLLAAEPLRERLYEMLMVALHRSGRRAEALAVYRDVRHVLADELGLEPGSDLRDLHAAILKGTSPWPSLDRRPMASSRLAPRA